MLTLDNFFWILKDVVQRMAVGVHQIDTIAVIDTIADANSSTFGMTELDFQDGFFWSRKYVEGGQKEFKRNYPALWIEWKTSGKLNPSSGQSCARITLNVLRNEQCTNCSEKETFMRRDIINEETLKYIIKTIHTKYNLYQIDDTKVWMHDDVAAKIKSANGPHGTMKSHLTEYSDIFLSKLGIDGIRSKGVDFKVCFCSIPSIEMDSTIDEVKYPAPAALLGCQDC